MGGKYSIESLNKFNLEKGILYQKEFLSFFLFLFL